MSDLRTPREPAAEVAVTPEAGDAHLRDLAESLAGVGRWRYEFGGEFVVWSEQAFRIFGAPPPQGDAVDLKTALACYCEADRAELGRLFTRARETGEGYEMRTSVRRLSDGEERFVISRAVVERDEDGALTALAGVIMDVTEAHRATLRLAASEARYRLIADHATDLILRFGPDGLISYCSPSVRLWGYEPEEIEGRTMRTFIHPEDLQAQDGMIGRLFCGAPVDLSVDRSLRARRKDGAYVWLEGAPSIVRDAQGAPVEVISVFRDVTVRKTLQAQLIAARDRAEAAAEAKAEFLANMSHELRTPLTAVLGFSQLAAVQPELTDETRRHLARVGHAGKALLSAVNDVLDLSKLEAGRLEITPRPLDVAELAGDTLDLFSADASTRGVALRAEGLEALPARVEVDPDRLRQVLLNLLGNAMKFTERGEVTLTARYDAGRGVLGFAVADTGCGVPADRLGSLFERFNQVDGSVARRHGGTGLGLAICKRLVEAMGGEVSAHSRLGEGSTFVFTVAAPVFDDACAPIDRMEEAPSGLAGARVLAVDDNAANRELIGAVLRPLGVTVTLVDSGPAALAVATTASFDAVLLDLRMPGMDGFETAARLRAGNGPNVRTPILAFSADALADLSDDFDGLVAKPLTLAGLYASLSVALQPGAREAGVRLRAARG